MEEAEQIVQALLRQQYRQETDWLEWKSDADLSRKMWQARAARFILGAANRAQTHLPDLYCGHAFLILGGEPGRAPGTKPIDPAVVGQGLERYLGTQGPPHLLAYVPVNFSVVAVITVLRPPAGARRYVARGTFSGEKEEIRDGRIYVRRLGRTVEASSAEIDTLLTERVAVRLAAGPGWLSQAATTWRDGDTVHVRLPPREPGDQMVIHTEQPGDREMLYRWAGGRPASPAVLPSEVVERVQIFDQLATRASMDPVKSVKDAWAPLRTIVVEAYTEIFGPPDPGWLKTDRLLEALAYQNVVRSEWAEVGTTLYYFSTSDDELMALDEGAAKTFLGLCRALGAAVLLSMIEARARIAQAADNTGDQTGTSNRDGLSATGEAE